MPPDGHEVEAASETAVVQGADALLRDAAVDVGTPR